MNTHDYLAIIKNHSQRLDPQPTGERAVLRKLTAVKAVLFDVYGTLFISGSGDMGLRAATTDAGAFCESLAAVGIPPPPDGIAGVDCLRRTIEDYHRASRDRGIEYPEVDIVAVWRDTLRTMSSRGALSGSWEHADCAALAVEYEVRTNPVWPMPGTRECLTRLASRGIVLGLVSNAQFYTPLLFRALLGGAPEAFGIAPHMQFYSYQHGQAKPGKELYRQAVSALANRQTTPAAALYVGNDMLNDICPAAAMGFHTALFAGDSRSLRRRQEDPRLSSLSPDLVLLNLMDLLSCISPELQG